MSVFEFILLRMWENADQNNSEYGHFARRKLLRQLLVFLLYLKVSIYRWYILAEMRNKRDKIDWELPWQVKVKMWAKRTWSGWFAYIWTFPSKASQIPFKVQIQSTGNISMLSFLFLTFYTFCTKFCTCLWHDFSYFSWIPLKDR